jgi:N-acetylneuraminic acid mutarotase
MWVIGGQNSGNTYNNDVWYSSDGANWQEAAAATAFTGRQSSASVSYNNEIWEIAGFDSTGCKSDVWYSSDGANWQKATAGAAFGPRTGHACIVFNNVIWVLAGYNCSGYLNDVWWAQ